MKNTVSNRPSFIKNLYFRQYETENAKRKAENRASEVNNVISAPGSTKVAWEQLGSFINFNASRGAHETDKSRMKSLLFKLKQEPPKVPTDQHAENAIQPIVTVGW